MTHDQAYRKVRTALASGVLVRPDTCSRCGRNPGLASDGRAMIQAHHHDYEKPLDVEWICCKCHREETPLPEKMGAPTFGVKNGQAKLDPMQVVNAKRLRETGLSYQKIADRFGVHKMTVMRAIKGIHWKGIEP